MKTLLILFTAGPGTLRAREQLDLALGCLACDLHLSVLFSGDAVALLQRARQFVDDDPSPQPRAYAALQAYGCQRVGACADSLRSRGLTQQCLAITVERLDAPQQSLWLHSVGQVLGD